MGNIQNCNFSAQRNNREEILTNVGLLHLLHAKKSWAGELVSGNLNIFSTCNILL